MGATRIFPIPFPHSAGKTMDFVTDSPTCPPGTILLIDPILTGLDRVVKTLNFSCLEHQIRDAFFSTQVTF